LKTLLTSSSAPITKAVSSEAQYLLWISKGHQKQESDPNVSSSYEMEKMFSL